MFQPGYNQRGLVATQACDSCRARKRKCDELRPSCSLCARLKLDCHYQDRTPERKQDTLSEVLDVLRQVNDNVQQLLSTGQQVGQNQLPAKQEQRDFDNEVLAVNRRLGENMAPLFTYSTHYAQLDRELAVPYRHSTAAHELLRWPFIQRKFKDRAVLSNLLPFETGLDWFLSLHHDIEAFSLPTDACPPPLAIMQFGNVLGISYPDIVKYSNIYFDTFNFMHPLLDRLTFFDETLPIAMRAKVTSPLRCETEACVLMLAVTALGQLALEKTIGNKITGHGAPNDEWDPQLGLFSFNEARRRLGFIDTGCSIQLVQIQSIISLYYSATYQHMESWRMSTQASATCYLHIRSKHHNWDTPNGDLLKRAYWHCVAMEVGHHLELGLPYSSLMDLEKMVPLPSFLGPSSDWDQKLNESSHFQHHYAALITLRRICHSFHTAVNQSLEYDQDTSNVAHNYASQLQHWKSLLPTKLKWEDYQETPGQTSTFMSWDTTRDDETRIYEYTCGIQVALLRTRYYYARYMIYRPIIYKALHFPFKITAQDMNGVCLALKSCLNWPLIFAAAKDKNSLIPYIFGWSQNFLGILLIFHCMHASPLLQSIRSSYISESDIQETLDLMTGWIFELRDKDKLAEWSSRVLDALWQDGSSNRKEEGLRR